MVVGGQSRLVVISLWECMYEKNEIIYRLFVSVFSFLSFLKNSAFEDETLRLRQLKLDNQVSRGSGGLHRWV